MEALRAAGRAVLRSPRLARHGLGLCWHRKLPENWADMQEPLLEGIGFTLKYLGMTLVEKPKGEDMAANAIRRIIAMARVGAKKFQKVILTVSPRGISLQDAETKEMIECVSIYRISYCTTDKLQNKVFAYVAQSPQNGALECHAFLSSKKKIAQAVTLTVAQAFQVALDHWETAQAGSVQEQSHPERTLESNRPGSTREPAPVPTGSTPFKHHFEEEEEEEEEDDDLNETFSGCTEEGTQDTADFVSPTPGGSSSIMRLPQSWAPPGVPPTQQDEMGWGHWRPSTHLPQGPSSKVSTGE